ncbi:MAG: glutathione S-transferase [Xanthomonadales bacterium]|nr:glutathione S-transferase [Xanthomonadales bacterium]
MITVHHLENSRSQRILWLLEELELDYEIRHYARDPETLLAPDELRAVHPLGKSPVVTDDGAVLAESGAIIETLVERHGADRLRPPRGTLAHDRYLYWLHYAEGSAMSPLLLKLVFDRLSEPPVPLFVRPISAGIAAGVTRKFIGPQLERHFGFIESELDGRDWFAGDHFSAADIQMSFPLEAAAARGVLGDAHPHSLDFLERIHARPAYQRALERGGPYALLS